MVLVWGPVEPFERGFYCDDESLSYPYNDSTIPGVVMEALGFIIPAIFVRQYIDGNSSKPPIMIFDENEIITEIDF